LTESWRTIPHVTSFLQIDVTNLVSYRQDLRSKGSDVALPAFFVKAIALAVERHPAMNATWSLAAGEILQHLDCHVGLAIDTPNGLLVPVVRDANTKSLSSLAEDVARLTDAANGGHLSPRDVRGATITLTNMGPGGIDAGTPIINPPEVAVVGVGSFGWRALVVNGQVVPRMACTVDCSFDHRAVDGVEASQFLRHFGDALENPELLTQGQSDDA
jgi:pyruvate dehydrogenase E2 component (dihydrolipoamide acetyltransferase)